MTRRQNRSCDQCRKAKRACNAPVWSDLVAGSLGKTPDVAPSESLDGSDPTLSTTTTRRVAETSTSTELLDASATGQGLSGEARAIDLERLVGPCEYCRKTNKRCTFNWVRSQVSRAHTGAEVRKNRRILTNRPRQRMPETPSVPSAPSTEAGTVYEFSTSPTKENSLTKARLGLHDMCTSDDPSPVAADFVARGGVSSTSHRGSDSIVTPPSLASSSSLSTDEEMTTAHLAPGALPFPHTDATHATTMNSTTATTAADRSTANTWPEIGIPDFACPPDMGRGVTMVLNSVEQDPADPEDAHTDRSLSFTMKQRNPQRIALPFSANTALSSRTNNQFITKSLMSIYHDVLEGALSCWLTEYTCPYKMPSKSSGLVLGMRSSPLLVSSGEEMTESMAQVWGSEWQNRIYQRVQKLERSAKMSNLISFTPSQEKMAAKALQLAILAFATQWAQGSVRQRAKMSSLGSFHSPTPGRRTSFDEEATSRGMAAEFDRTMQLGIWNEAKRVLSECSGLDSFRLVCAELIFSMTQKPINDCEIPRRPPHTQPVGSSVYEFLYRIREVIADDTPSMYTERAARRVHKLKYRFERFEKGFASAKARREPAEHCLDEEDRRTIGLLYWMALMLDTLSSAMNDRPVVVSDDDCNPNPGDEAPQTIAPGAFRKPRPWNDLFVKDAPVIRWPCSYEDAAKCLSEAAPVKVLLFRHVTYLQSRITHGVHGAEIDDAVQDALAVYKHWSIVYAPFFQDCIQVYSDLPQRVRSWFIPILGHYCLGALLLADLIELVDHAQLGSEEMRRSRAMCKLADEMKDFNACILSDMARVSTAGLAEDEYVGARLDDFHFAVNEASILTEPWTIILIRAFAGAGAYHLEKAIGIGAGYNNEMQGAFLQGIQRCDECIKGLWLLGKKSDMANQVFQLLSEALSTAISDWRGRSETEAPPARCPLQDKSKPRVHTMLSELDMDPLHGNSAASGPWHNNYFPVPISSE